jgi:predicted DNA-binding protein YlxM (UPF0122 family)
MSTSAEKSYTVGMLLDFYGELLPQRQRQVADLYYNDDLSLSEVAEECGITRQGVRDALKKAEEQLRSFEERLGLLEKHIKSKETLTGVLARLEELSTRGVDTEDLKEAVKGLL